MPASAFSFGPLPRCESANRPFFSPSLEICSEPGLFILLDFPRLFFSTALQHDHHRLWRFFVDTIATSPHNFLVRLARNFSRLRGLTPTLVSGWLLGDESLCPFCRARPCNASILIVKQGVAGCGLSKPPRNNARAAARSFAMSARPLRLAIIFAHARSRRVLDSARTSPAHVTAPQAA